MNESELPTQNQMFRPNIYPIMYWALAYGVAASVLLFIIFLIGQYLTGIWVPAFLVGLIWGGLRNYKKQKSSYEANAGVASPKQSPVNEFKQAVKDIAIASQEIFAQNDNPAADSPDISAANQSDSETQDTQLPPEPPQSRI